MPRIRADGTDPSRGAAVRGRPTRPPAVGARGTGAVSIATMILIVGPATLSLTVLPTALGTPAALLGASPGGPQPSATWATSWGHVYGAGVPGYGIGPAAGGLLNVTFKALRLPAGSQWSVSAGTPPTTATNTTVGSRGKIVFPEPPGILNYSILGPSGYGVARILGADHPSLGEANITAPTVLTIYFGPLETVSFNESNLSRFQMLPGATWSVSLTPAARYGGPPSQSATTNGSSLSFRLPAGAAYKFSVAPTGAYAAEYGALVSHGGLLVRLHPQAHVVRFHLLPAGMWRAPFEFTETDLPFWANWTVTITNGSSPLIPYPYRLTEPAGTAIEFHLPNGTYNWTISSSGGVPNPSAGTSTIQAGLLNNVIYVVQVVFS